MSDTSENRTNQEKHKQICAALLAHVDAGKTTLSEAMLYESGTIRRLGRVDNKDAFLDTNHMERDRGITIFSKQARFAWEDGMVTLLDTPGHVDFSAEMERTLQVLDYAVLVVSASEGVQSHTETLWRLLAYYHVPVFLFINKMDMPGVDRGQVLQELQTKLSDSCTDFGTEESVVFDAAAMCEETLLEQFLEQGTVDHAEICRLIRQRKLFPCYFGSALKNEGIHEFMDGFWQYTEAPEYGKKFGARVYKIARDEQGNRLTYLKVLGGTLQSRQLLQGTYRHEDVAEQWEEKVNQIRLYSGDKFTQETSVEAGTICAVSGLHHTYPGEGLGFVQEDDSGLLEPVLNYRLELPPDMDAARAMPMLKQLEEEEPELHIVWDEQVGEIHAQVMGDVQIEIICQQLKERYGMSVQFGAGSIVYKETIAEPVVGVGHFEPLRHYAEVHLLLEPGEPGSGLVFESRCSEEVLDKNWQRLILTHLEERRHRGVLTGSQITDMRISVIAGRAHQKHTEGGDFRQATYRAVRQGLRKAESILLEPYYAFRIELPTEQLGRAMTDIERMAGKMQSPDTKGEWSILTGEAPVAEIGHYQRELAAYTGGRGRISCTLSGYRPCHNTEEVLEHCSYDPDLDLAQTADSVFCAHGSGFIVPWTEVEEHMHVEDGYAGDPQALEARLEQEAYEAMSAAMRRRKGYIEDYSLGEDEIHSILGQAVGANRSEKKARPGYHKKRVITADRTGSKPVRPYRSVERYLLVDGYNIVFAWEELNELAKTNIDAARDRLMDILCNYQAYTGYHLMLVFDAYKVKGGTGSVMDYHNIQVIYTKEAETADQYIEKYAHQMGRDYDVTVATSDGLEQVIIRGQGCKLLSAREFLQEVKCVEERIEEQIQSDSKGG